MSAYATAMSEQTDPDILRGEVFRQKERADIAEAGLTKISRKALHLGVMSLKQMADTTIKDMNK